MTRQWPLMPRKKHVKEMFRERLLELWRSGEPVIRIRQSAELKRKADLTNTSRPRDRATAAAPARKRHSSLLSNLCPFEVAHSSLQLPTCDIDTL